jgi:hypothetical protein
MRTLGDDAQDDCRDEVVEYAPVTRGFFLCKQGHLDIPCAVYHYALTCVRAMLFNLCASYALQLVCEQCSSTCVRAMLFNRPSTTSPPNAHLRRRRQWGQRQQLLEEMKRRTTARSFSQTRQCAVPEDGGPLPSLLTLPKSRQGDAEHEHLREARGPTTAGTAVVAAGCCDSSAPRGSCCAPSCLLKVSEPR